MDLKQIRCVLAAAEEMHFGRAARSLDMLPAGLGRQIRLLEEELGIALFARTTRSVVLTDAGRDFVRDARPLVDAADGMVERFRDRGRTVSRVIRLGAIDSAAAQRRKPVRPIAPPTNAPIASVSRSPTGTMPSGVLHSRSSGELTIGSSMVSASTVTISTTLANRRRSGTARVGFMRTPIGS